MRQAPEGCGAAILGVAPALIRPSELLPAAVTLAFDCARGRVLCLGAAPWSALLVGLAPAWQAAELVPAQTRSRQKGGRIFTRMRGGRVR